ncbi:MAG: hypothetical protein AAF244_02975 [Pseudomonadota bacterium]
MIRTLIFSTSLLALSACATVISGQTQEVTMRTPGAKHALCRLNTGGNLYDIYTDQTIRVNRVPHNMIIHCMASGNRERTVSMEWSGNEWGFLNVANGVVPGVTYDIIAGGAFEYPNELVVDFRGMPATAYPLPEYHNKDISQFNHGEFMGATTVDMPADTRDPVDLPYKEQTYQNFGTGSDVRDEQPQEGPVYPITEAVSPYDPGEEKK